ncbi:MAG TPA: chemotaxis protein CheW [Polyangiales bacterium]
MDISVGRDDLTVLIFELEGHRYGLHAADIREVTRAAAPTRLAQAPRIVEGLINLRGEVAVVIDLRARFGLPLRRLSPSDVFLVCRIRTRLVALRVDAVLALQQVDAGALVPAPEVTDGALHLSGVLTLADGLIFLGDLPSFLSQAESDALAEAVSQAERGGGDVSP